MAATNKIYYISSEIDPLPLQDGHTKTNPAVLKPETHHHKSRNYFLLFTVLIVNLMGLSTGIGIGWTSPTIPKLNGNKDPDENPLGRPISVVEGAWITASMSVGAILSPFLVGFSAEKIGRKRTLLLLACPIIASLLIMAFAKTVVIFYIARFLIGLGNGGSFTMLPMYLGEIAENSNRGAISCTMGVFISAGFLVAYSVGPFLTVQNFCFVCLAPALIFVVVFALFGTETPLYLASTKNKPGLEKSLSKLRNKPSEDLYREIADITKAVEESRRTRGGYGDLFKSEISRKALLITVGLIGLQQFAGISAVLPYMQTIFEATGSQISPEISTIIIGTVQVLTTVLTSFLVDRLGRKILLLVSATGCCASLTALGVYFHLKTDDFKVDVIFWLPICSLLVFIVAYNMGIRPVPWTLLAEMFPPNVKHVASTLAAVTFFVGSLVITLVFPSVNEVLGMAASFWMFAVVCIFGDVFVYFMLPETKGLGVQEIQLLLEGKHQLTHL